MNTISSVWVGRNRSSMSAIPDSHIIDGGGVRGYWSLLVLEALMKEIGKEERRHAHNRREESHSFYPQQLPTNYTQCEDTMPDNCENPVRYHAQRYLPCHYFDLICGSSTGRFVHIRLRDYCHTHDLQFNRNHAQSLQNACS